MIEKIAGEPAAGRPGGEVIAAILKKAEPRPAASDKSSVKNQYAVRFADAAAAEFVEDLRPLMAGISASPKRTAKSVGGTKQLDINFSTPATGLALGISLKSVHIRELTGGKRYTHNMKRNEEELRIEASGYHKRQPYAVMVGVLFLPFDSCDDGKAGPSSFGSWVKHLRPFTGRSGPHDDADRFEKIYVALYDADGSDLSFFDVDSAPPKRGRPPADGHLYSDGETNRPPRRSLSYPEFIESIYGEFLRRNKADFKWADGSSEPLKLNAGELGADEDEDEI